ncbi:DUF3105 domain-containing protein [Actinomadura craniellae]|uniref:DUF3105 domain-containing protein n=1 Tax=Actinomadura craniellae TaxID=2231787 RepID=A0A365HGQ2_9ACTN|nr:DUF3105 domain-containing protein [Actinomadura craniellae]RAY17223.1 DUF3105 domain-containing protein [Actinomadura craniellae]
MSKKTAQRRPKPKRNELTRKTPPWGGIIFFTCIGLIAVAAIGYAAWQARPVDTAGIDGLVETENLSRNHTPAAVSYPTNPPMGGDHDSQWQNCDGRVYDQALRNENAVHSLEHGAVWITYRPGLPAGQLDQLRDTVEKTDYTMLSPVPNQDSPVTLTAWGKQLKLQDAGDQRVSDFLRAFVKGPQTPEPGAACTGGKATP